jgi:hypothetical protein
VVQGKRDSTSDKKPSKKIDKENPTRSNRQVQVTFKTPLADIG